jgi:hypothetical protein
MHPGVRGGIVEERSEVAGMLTAAMAAAMWQAP